MIHQLGLWIIYIELQSVVEPLILLPVPDYRVRQLFRLFSASLVHNLTELVVLDHFSSERIRSIRLLSF